MTYTFNAISGETRSSLVERVLFNSFSAARYGEFVKRAVNDAVTTICRRPPFGEAYEVQAYNSVGVVQIGTSRPWFKINEVWTARASAPSTGEVAFAAATGVQLGSLGRGDVASLATGSPLGYIVRRPTAPSGFAPSLDIRILPPGGGGFVAIKGLQRPAVMATDGDLTGLGAEFDGAVVAFAKAACFENESAFDESGQWRARFEAELRQATEGGDDEDGPDVVEGMWSC